MTDLERRLADASPHWPEPSDEAGARARAALGLDEDGSSTTPPARRWWRRRTAGRLLLAGAVLAGAAAAATAAIITSGSGAVVPAAPASLDFGDSETAGGPVDASDGSPRVAVDGAGRVTVVWGRAGRVVARTREPGGRWGAEVVLSDPAERAADPAVAAGADGTVAVVWRQRTAARSLEERFTLPSGAPAGRFTDIVDRRWTVVARVRAAAGAWAPADALSQPTAQVRDIEAPDVGVAADGTAVVVWDQGQAAWAAGREPGGRWEAVNLGEAEGEAVRPVVAVDPSGRAVATWASRTPQGHPDGLRYTPYAALRSVDGAWDEARAVGAPAPGSFYLTTAIDGDRAGVLWTQGTGGGPERAHVALHEDGEWGAPEVVVPASTGRYVFRDPVLVLEAGGGAVALVRGASPALVRMAPGGAWAPTRLGARRLLDGRMTRDGAGRAVLAWRPDRDLMVGAVGDMRWTIVPGAGSPQDMAVGAGGTSALVWTAPRAGDSRPSAPSEVVVSVAEGEG